MNAPGRWARLAKAVLIAAVLLAVTALWQQPRLLLELTQSLVALCT